jgi:hypothetical protein
MLGEILLSDYSPFSAVPFPGFFVALILFIQSSVDYGVGGAIAVVG